MNAALPALSVLVAVLATAVPFELPTVATFILPMVVVTMVFCWRAFPGTVFPLSLGFLLGLLTDILSGGPLGFWALMAVIAANAGSAAPPLDNSLDRNRLWLIWAGVAFSIGALSWLLCSLYLFRVADIRPIALGASVSILLFPLLSRLLVRIKGGSFRPKFYRGWT